VYRSNRSLFYDFIACADDSLSWLSARTTAEQSYG
jgi:hypothetical protein